ncbi:uncharacterized protein EAE98_003310 [Botrytis deweyae]|uniref:UBC core domain-containing protein n=1 Tax=Botrytis deweyae TaxID=2478750 RepID=A0ABQ7IT77_9HELO|nr:uncharacterized protein EAE98_003310 [Botrytis deweyae]KAF7933601.1 hypothetical protein EAE98_003310 [Botrytis deweyae]
MQVSNSVSGKCDTLALEGEARSSRLRTVSPQRTRVIVNFDDQPSTKLIVPVTSATTINDLQSLIFNRAERIQLKLPGDRIVLRLEGEDGPITFSEDTIEDIFGDADPKLIWVTAAPKVADRGAEFIYVRWITPGRALDHVSLSDIETDEEPLTRGMTANEIIAVAKNRVFGAAGDEVTPAPGFNIGLWFNKAGEDTSVWALGTDTPEKLGLTGSLENPLDIFLVLINEDNPNPNLRYGFRCSLRSMATFETCLKVLISAASFRPYLIPRLLQRMILVTNIGEAKNCLESSLKMMAVPEAKKTILANCFREIALMMVPGAFIGHKIESVLEGSRQIFAWMFSDILEEDFKPVKGKRMPIPATDDFQNIINVCNSSQHFRMLSPLQLDERENSGISLSKAGYVSQYTQNSDEISQPRLENVVTGFETLQSRPGQSLLQALQSVISQRIMEGTWEIDDWERIESSSSATNPGPDEAIVICLDKSISMQASLGNDWIGNGQINTLNRFDEAKQVFRNVVSRLSAYHLNVHVGLVTFGSKAEQEAQISPISKEFKNKLENTQATDHRTSLFDALHVAHSKLVSHQEQYPKSEMKLRIIALTDGEDNSSVSTAEEIRAMFYEDDIVLDSIVIGGSSSEDLFKISKYTGGYAFKPTSRMLLFQTFLLEPFLDILARPDIVKIPLDDYESSLPKEADMKTIHDFPPCRPHQLQDGGFVSLDAATRQLAGKSSSLLETSRMSASAEPANRSTGRLFLDEMRLMIANPHASMDVYVSEVDMAFWKIVMSGPASTAYSEGTFSLFVHMTDTYPQKAPAVRFITLVLHPNVSKVTSLPQPLICSVSQLTMKKHGRICHEIFDDGWKSSFHIHDILKTIFTLFENPKASCDAAIDELATLKFWTDRATADAEIKRYVTRFATRTRVQWKREMESTG